MVDYRNIDWTQYRPDSEELERGWLASHIVEAGTLDRRLAAVVSSLAETHGNGGACAAQFHLDVHPAVAWFLVRNRLPEAGFFRKFFGHEIVRRHFVAPSAKEIEGDLGFGQESRFVAMGRLAQVISSGGAYCRFEGPDANVLTLSQDFMQAAFGGRYAESPAYLSWKPWSPWFKGIAWDASFFWFDLRTATATVLLSTDTD